MLRENTAFLRHQKKKMNTKLFTSSVIYCSTYSGKAFSTYCYLRSYSAGEGSTVKVEFAGSNRDSTLDVGLTGLQVLFVAFS